VLGYAVILKRKGVLATVHSRRVLALASRSGVEAAVLMGRVMAHEVGHLLLGTNAHAPRGLMRADWKLNEWSMSEHSDWTFTADEVLRMRRSTLSARN
jgi:activator of HSP90 ATPase